MPMEPESHDPPPGGDQRSERRQRALKSAQIVMNGGHSTIDCVVRDLSPGGARLELPSTVGVPERFDIIIGQSGTRRPCRVMWHTDRLLGIHFEDAKPAV